MKRVILALSSAASGSLVVQAMLHPGDAWLKLAIVVCFIAAGLCLVSLQRENR